MEIIENTEKKVIEPLVNNKEQFIVIRAINSEWNGCKQYQENSMCGGAGVDNHYHVNKH